MWKSRMVGPSAYQIFQPVILKRPPPDLYRYRGSHMAVSGAPALAGIGVVVAQENTRPPLSAGGCSFPERLDLVRNPCRPCLPCRRLAASPASAPASPPPSPRW